MRRLGWALLALSAWACGGDDEVVRYADARPIDGFRIDDNDAGEPIEGVDGGDRCAGADCSELSGPCGIGACDPASGECVVSPVAEGAACDDGDPCTTADHCAAGACVAEPLCAPSGDPCAPNVCDPATLACAVRVLGEGAACDDGDACTTDDTCTATGTCAPSGALDCSAMATQCAAPSCDRDLGCTVVFLEGGACDDGDGCTDDDLCDGAGACTGSPIDCSPLGGPCLAAVCDPATRACVVTPAVDGAACDDGDACTTEDACDAGLCRGTPIACGGTRCAPEACDPGTGSCVAALAASGVPCDDGSACTAEDRCDGGGSCVGQSLDCGDPGPCASARCDPATGCAVTPVMDGTSCGTDECQVQVCVAGACDRSPAGDCTACVTGVCRDGACGDEYLTLRESFEGDLPASWTGTWAPVDTMAVDGRRALRSPPVVHGSSASVHLPVDLGEGAEVRFTFRTSTAPGDRLQFLVDGAVRRQWEGQTPWGTVSVPVEGGRHQLTWRYAKDASGTAGDDAVYIDAVEVVGLAQQVVSFTTSLAPFTNPTGSATGFSRTAAFAYLTGASARSAPIGANQTATTQWAFTLPRAGRISMFFALDAAVGDQMVLDIDSVERFRFEGSGFPMAWQPLSLPVGAGPHSLRIRYVKGGGGSATGDALFIDEVALSLDGCE